MTERLKGSVGVINYGSLEVASSRHQQPSTLIEPVIFLFLVAKALSDSVITNLLEFRTCKAQLVLSDENCTEPLSSTVEDLVQPTTTHIITARAIIEALTPSCLAILVGPWSDINGRKPFLIFALTGMSITYLCWGCLALLPKLYPQMFLLASVPVSMTGGSCVVYLLTFCYISDVTDEHTRPFRMSVMTLAIYFSSIIGVASAPWLVSIQHTLNPYPLIFFLSAFLLLLTSLYTHWYIHESVEMQPNRETRLFLFNHVRNLSSACFKQRVGHARTMTLFIMTTLTLNQFLSEGEGAVIYLSVRKMFSWKLSDYSWFSCSSFIVYGLGSPCGVWLFKSLLGLPNMLGAVLCLATRCARAIIMAASYSGPHFYISILVSSLFAAYAPLSRTELSRLIPKQDLGKIFAMTSFLECLTPMATTPLYSFIYEYTFLKAPGAIYWLSALLSAISVLIIITVVIIQNLVGEACYINDYPRGPESENHYTDITSVINT